MSIKKSIFIVILCVGIVTAGFAAELSYAGVRTNGLDIELSQVNVSVQTFDEARIAYRFELAEGKKLSCIETQRTLRIRQMSPSRGILYIFIPKTLLLENCSIRVSRADVSLEGMQAVSLLTMLNMGNLSLKEGSLKTAVINLARGKMLYNQTQVVRSCAFTVTDADVDIVFPSEEAEYHVDYVQNGGSLTIAGTELTKSPGEYGNARAKRRIIFSGAAAKTSVGFTQKRKDAQSADSGKKIKN